MFHRFPDFFDSQELDLPGFDSQIPSQPSSAKNISAKNFSAGRPANGSGSFDNDSVPDEQNSVPASTLAVIRDAANRQWRRLQESGIETSKLMELASTILLSVKGAAGETQELSEERPNDAQGLSEIAEEPLQNPEVGESAWDSLLDSASEDWEKPTAQEAEDRNKTLPAASVGGTINLNYGKSEPMIVSLEAFFQFSFEFSEALNDLVEKQQNPLW